MKTQGPVNSGAPLWALNWALNEAIISGLILVPAYSPFFGFSFPLGRRVYRNSVLWCVLWQPVSGHGLQEQCHSLPALVLKVVCRGSAGEDPKKASKLKGWPRALDSFRCLPRLLPYPQWQVILSIPLPPNLACMPRFLRLRNFSFVIFLPLTAGFW